MPILPIEIIIYHLLPVLAAEEAVNVCEAFDIEVTEQLYHSIFPDRTQFDHYNLKLLKERLHCSLYLYGYTTEDVSTLPAKSARLFEEVQNLSSGCDFSRQVVPARVNCGPASIVKLSACSKVSVICSDGRGYRGKRLVKKDGEYQLYYVPKAEPGSTIVDAASFSLGNFALDSTGRIWAATDYGGHRLLRMKENYDGARPVAISTAGFWLSVRYNNDQLRLFCAPRHQDVEPREMYSICDVTDYVGLTAVHLCLGTNGFLQVRQKKWGRGEQEMTKEMAQEINKRGPFVQPEDGPICMQNWRVVHHLVVLAKSGKGTIIQLCDGAMEVDDTLLEGLDLASISASSSHCLGLTKKGEAYSWGSEINGYGYLGVGRYEDILNNKNMSTNIRGSETLRPVRMNFEGRAYAVVAGKHESYVLVYGC